MKADRQKTIDQQYLNPKSFMRSDGSESLRGEDWDARKAELLRRSDGRCEYLYHTPPCEGLRCTQDADDPHHVIRRSVRRDDRLENLLALCRFHHDLLDKRKIRSDRKEHHAAMHNR